MASNNTVAQQNAAQKEAARDAKSAADQAKFDKMPIFLQMLSGIGTLVLVTAIGFAVLFAIDILFLDWDPIAKIIGLVTE
jgi:hypothetical protein